MKVYIINSNWGSGGPGGIAKDLYFTLLNNGHNARFGYSRGRIPKEINSFKFGTKIDVYIHALFTRIFDKGGFLSNFATYHLIKDIRKYKPDVISIHNPLGYTINVPLLLKSLDQENIPIFYTLHDCWLFTGHCICMLCDKLKEGCGRCPNKTEYPASYIFDCSRKNLLLKQKHIGNLNNLYLISCSNWIYNLANQSYLGKYQNRIINNGIDLNCFKPMDSNFRKNHNIVDKKIILGVASIWSKWKGQKYLIELADIIANDFIILMVGDGIWKETKKKSNIICIDSTNNLEELVKIYSTADVFVNTTIGDNFPTVNLEAIACGTPVVTFDTGGSGEMIGDFGEVVEQGNVKELYFAICRVLNKKIDRNACHSYAKKYDKNIKYKQYIDLFNETLENNERGVEK